MSRFSLTLQPLLRNLRSRAGPKSRSLPSKKLPHDFETTLKSTKERKRLVRRSSTSKEAIQQLVPITHRGDSSFGRVIKSPHLRGCRSSHWLVLNPFLQRTRRRATKEQSDPNQFVLSNRHHQATRMRSYVQILTTPTADTPGTTLLLHFDDKRYIIGNVSEGTQRACVQQKIGMSKVQDILLTGKTNWSSNGGLLGMILTMADVFATQAAARKENPSKIKKDRQGSAIVELPKRLRIYGTENLAHLLATARRFIFRKGMPLDIIESQDSIPPSDISTPSWSDNNVKVWAMDVMPSQSSSCPSRKRSHDEISADGKEHVVKLFDGKIDELTEEMADRHSQIRKGVVGHMFESDWQLDALKPLKLSQVAMPAAIFVRNEAGRIEKYTGPLPGGDEYVPDIDVLVRSPWPGATIQSLPPTTPSTLCRSYIIKNYPQRGKFNPKVAIELGVKPGRSFSDLTKGVDVVTEAGTTVTPNMVMSPEKVGGAFAVVELPSEDYIEGLLNRKEWSSEIVMEGVGTIIWILGKDVLMDERLVSFRSKHSHLKHIISSVDCCFDNLAFESAAMAAVKLHLVDSERFPVPAYSNSLPGDATIPRNFTKAQVGSILQLEPSLEVKEDMVTEYFDPAKAIIDCQGIQGDLTKRGVFTGISEEVLELSQAAQIRVNDTEYLAKLAKVQDNIPYRDAELITLGTGSALPSKYRNVSATLLRVPGTGNYLFDCGENTLGQLKRVFGKELPQILKDLKVIWISHLHADHHLGTVSVLSAWNEETSRSQDTRSERIHVASESGMLQWLSEYSQVEDFGYSRVSPLCLNYSNKWTKVFSGEDTDICGLSSIVACQVSHCNEALAVVFKFPNGFKVAYSGDCRPSSDFAQIGKDATVLIHEATFDNELQGDAMAKKHCTTAEALWVAKKMNARRILLTHFSQRYQKIPAMDDSGDQVAIVAFDYMRCKVGDFAKVAEYRPALLKLYETEATDE